MAKPVFPHFVANGAFPPFGQKVQSKVFKVKGAFPPLATKGVLSPLDYQRFIPTFYFYKRCNPTSWAEGAFPPSACQYDRSINCCSADVYLETGDFSWKMVNKIIEIFLKCGFSLLLKVGSITFVVFTSGVLSFCYHLVSLLPLTEQFSTFCCVTFKWLMIIHRVLWIEHCFTMYIYFQM